MDAGTAAARVEALMELRRYDEAVDAARAGLVGEPEDARLQCNLAWALVAADRDAEGLAAAESAIRLAPDYEFPHRLRAHALIGLGRHREAIAAAEEAVSLAPYWADCHVAMAAALIADGRRDEARRAAERARELAPESPDGHFWLGRIALESKDLKAATAHLDAALALDPGSSLVLNELGLVFDREGNWQRALRYYERAARADPSADAGRRNLVWNARVQLYGVMLASGLILVAVVVAVLLLFGTAAAGFALVFSVSGVVELVRHRREVLDALSPTAREVSRLRR